MPQLAIETVVTQYFWLIVILFGFYYIAVTKVIPSIANALKTRKALENEASSTSEASDASKAKAFLTTALKFTPPTSSNSADYSTIFEKASGSWAPLKI